ncbi:Endonuclease/exonuclease/phosphatase domain containing protein [Plasmodium coatneyi]|uniref:Endonuclease/exonuclease/phosphatase domain containing protein n=1 Tax=Plasmodium coatneyi TaxID=208452 RepID=A0A1B1DX55_9APIC|nr:Endonuclease/exonuclease/phosphatase domain containing protein [Plasmodium coatneyi]ANQ07362.1 Endonuclease/exonuclease/phosphatase domain containing protein [Plasmodium coatneyi]
MQQLLRLVLLDWLIERLIERLIGRLIGQLIDGLIDRLVLHALSEVKNRMRNFLLHCIKKYVLCLCNLLDVTDPTDIRNLSYDHGEGRIDHPTMNEPPRSCKRKANSEDHTSGVCSRVRPNKITGREQKKHSLLRQKKHHSSGLIFSQQEKIQKREKINLTLHLFIERNEDANFENPPTVLSAFLKNDDISSRQKNVQNSDPRLYIHRMVQNKCYFIHRAEGIGLSLKEFPSLKGVLHVIITHKGEYLLFYLIEGEIFFFCCLLNTSLAVLNGLISLFFEIYPRFANVFTIKQSHVLCSYLAHACEAGLSVFFSELCSLRGDRERSKDPSSVGTDKKEKKGKLGKNGGVNNSNRTSERDIRGRTKLRFTKSSINYRCDEPQGEYPKHPDKTHKVNIKETVGGETFSTNRREDETRMTQNGNKRNSPRCMCGNHEGVDQNEINEKENDKDNEKKEDTNRRRNGNRNGDNRTGNNNGDRHNSDDNNNNDRDDEEDDDDEEMDDKEKDENEEENDEDDKKKNQDGKRNCQGGKGEVDRSDVITEQSDEQKGPSNCADDVKNGSTDMQSDSNKGDGNGNEEEGEGVKGDSVDEGSNTLDGHSSPGEDRPNVKLAEPSDRKSSGVSSCVPIDQRNDQTGKEQKDEKNLQIMNKMLKNLSFMSFNTGLLEYKICGVCIYQNPPFISSRLMHIPYALKKTNADIIALQEVYDEKHVEYLKNQLMANYPFCARDNYCSDVFREKFGDANVAREDEFDENNQQDGKDGPTNRRANSYESGKRTGTTVNNPNGGNKKELRGTKKKYFALHHGLLVFSKYPIIYSFFHGFKHVTYLEYLFGTKGFLEVVIDVPCFSYITLVNMHLASGAADTESKYIERVRDFEIKQIMEIARNAEKRNTIPIIIGDLNAAPNLCPNNYTSFIKRGWKDAWLYARNVKKKKTKQLIAKALPRLQKKKARTISSNSCRSLSHLFPKVGSSPKELVKEAGTQEREENHPILNNQEGVRNTRKEDPVDGITNKDYVYSNHSVNAEKSIYLERPPLCNKMDVFNDELGSSSSLRVFPTLNCSENNDSIVYTNSMKSLSRFSKNLESYDNRYYNERYTKERKKWNVGDKSVECHRSVCLNSTNLKNHESEIDKMNSALNEQMHFRNGLQSSFFGCFSHGMTVHSRRCVVTGAPSKRLHIVSGKVEKTVSKTIWRGRGNFLPASYKRVKHHHRKGCTRGCYQIEHLPPVKQIPSSGKKHSLKGHDNMNASQRGDIPLCRIIPNSSNASGNGNSSDVIPERKGKVHMLTDKIHYRQMSPMRSSGHKAVNHQEGDRDMLESILHVSETRDDLFNPSMGQQNGQNCYADKRVKGDKKEKQRNIQSCSTCDVFKKESKIDHTIVTPKCTLRSKSDGEKLKIHREDDDSEYHAATNMHHHYNSDQNLFSSDISSESNHSYTDLYDDDEEANWFSDRSSNVSRNDLQERTEMRVPIEAQPSNLVNCMTEEGFTNGDTTEKAPETIKELHTLESNQMTDKKYTKREDKIMTHCVPPSEMGEKSKADERTPLIHPKDAAQVSMSNEKGDDTSNHAQMPREKDSKLNGSITFYKNQLNDHKEKVHNVDENCEDKLKTQKLCSAFLKEELASRGETHEEDSLLSEGGTRRDSNENSCNGKVESLPCTGTYATEENANINTNKKEKKISKLAKKIKQMKKKLLYKILRNYERHHNGGVERTLLKGKQGEPQKAKQDKESNSLTIGDVKRKAEKKHHFIHSLNEGEHTEKETNCKGEATPAEDHSPKSDVAESMKNQMTNEKGKNKSDKFLHFTKKCYNSRTQEALKKDIFYFIKKLKFEAAKKIKQKFLTCAKNVKGSLSEEKKLFLMEKEQKGELQRVHHKCPFVQNNSDNPRSFSSIKVAEDFIKMCDCSPMSKKEKNQRSKNYNREKASTREGPENYPKSKKYSIFKRRHKDEKDKCHFVENINEGRIPLDDHTCVNPNRNSSKNKKFTQEFSGVRGGEPNQGKLHNKMKLNIKNKSFFKLKNEENISSDEFTWDPLNPLNVIGPHSRCNGLRCDYIFFPPISYNKGKGARGAKNGTAEKGKIDQKGKPRAAEKTDEEYKMGAVKSKSSVHMTKMRDDQQLVVSQGKAPNRSNVSSDPVGASRESEKYSNSVLNTQNDAFPAIRNERDRKDDHQVKGKRYEETLNLKKYNDLKILKNYYIKSAKILFNEPSVMVHTNRNSKNANCCYSFCMKIKNVHFVTMSDHYAIKIDLRLKKNHKFGRSR